MRPLTVGVLLGQEWAKGLGKKSTESDIQLASFREGHLLCSLVLPLRYPEKPQALAYSIHVADALLLVVEGMTKELGECILAAHASGISQGLILLRNFVQPEQLAPLLKGTSLERWPVLQDDKVAAVRAKLAEFQVPPKPGPLRIPVDHHFDVKGIGTVVLGFVKQGSVRRHESYRLYPTAKLAQVRSIQVHDEDVDEAPVGDHVGLALKGVTNDEVDRGHVMAPDGTLEARPEGGAVRLRVEVARFFKAGLQAGPVYYLALGMQFVPLRVAAPLAAGQAGTLEATLQKPLAFEKGQRGTLFSLDAAQRVVGAAVIDG